MCARGLINWGSVAPNWIGQTSTTILEPKQESSRIGSSKTYIRPCNMYRMTNGVWLSTWSLLVYLKWMPLCELRAGKGENNHHVGPYQPQQPPPPPPCSLASRQSPVATRMALATWIDVVFQSMYWLSLPLMWRPNGGRRPYEQQSYATRAQLDTTLEVWSVGGEHANHWPKVDCEEREIICHLVVVVVVAVASLPLWRLPLCGPGCV